MKKITKNNKTITKNKKTITKKQLIQEIHEKENISPKKVKTVLEAFLQIACNHVANGGRIEIRDFGVFSCVLRKQKIGRNPKKARVPIIIPPRLAIKFAPGKKMKKLLQKNDHKLDSTTLKESSTL